MRVLLLGFIAAVHVLGQAPGSNPLTETVMSRYRSVKNNLIETAALMPERSYSFRLTPPQRTFAEWIGHTAMGNYSFCASIRGETAPRTDHLKRDLAKSELEKELKESFAYCDAALEGMSDKKALAPLTVKDRTTYPVQGMIALIVSGNEHYGNLVGYLRTKGIVPPSTARANRPVRIPEHDMPKEPLERTK